jgi:hypothetical protein
VEAAAGPEEAAPGQGTTIKSLSELDGAFVCPEADCGESYKLYSSLRHHLGLQHGRQVRNHELTRWFTTQFNCSLCREQITGWAAFKVHRRQHALVKKATGKVAETRHLQLVNFTAVGSVVGSCVAAASCAAAADNPAGDGDVMVVAELRGADFVLCPLCTRSFANERQMLKHRAASH